MRRSVVEIGWGEGEGGPWPEEKTLGKEVVQRMNEGKR